MPLIRLLVRCPILGAFLFLRQGWESTIAGSYGFANTNTSTPEAASFWRNNCSVAF